MNSRIYKPIFITGMGRSGTTVLYELFTRHKDTAYLEHYSNKFFNSPNKFRFIPLLHKYRKIRYGIDRPKPTQGLVYERLFKRFEYIDETDISQETKKFLFNAIETELKIFKTNRFVNKSGNHCLRIRWLNELFPDAYYIIIWRDPKAVVSSSKRRNWPHWSLIKEKFGKDLSDIELCIKHYQFYKNHLLQDLPLINARCIEVNYEDLVRDTRRELKRLYDFTELHWYDEIKKDIPEHLELHNNEKWKTLPDHEQKLLIKTFPS